MIRDKKKKEKRKKTRTHQTQPDLLVWVDFDFVHQVCVIPSKKKMTDPFFP